MFCLWSGLVDKTRTQLLLRWPRSVAKVEFLLRLGYLTFTLPFSVIFDNIVINHISAETRFFGRISFATVCV